MVQSVRKRKWLKWVVGLMLAPVALFALLMVLLYVPPVQNYIRQQTTTIASEATGMQIDVERIHLRFPLNLLVTGVKVVQPATPPDTLLTLQSLNVHVQAWPLLRGRIEVDNIALEEVTVNSAHLLPGMKLQGVLGDFTLQSHGVDLSRESVVLNDVHLSDTHVHLLLNDTTDTPPDTTASAPLNWRVELQRLHLQNLSVEMEMPTDSTMLRAAIGETLLEDAVVDFRRQAYAWRKFLLTGSAFSYDVGTATPAEGFDPAHIALRDIQVAIDSVHYHGRNMNAAIRQLSMYERSGLSITSLTGHLHADTTLIRVPDLRLSTPHSEMDFSTQTYWELLDIPTSGQLSARFNAYIGKQDVMLLASGVPETFKEAYPFRPLVIHAGTEGNLKQMQISRFTAELPGAFTLSGGGELWHLTDSLKRNGSIDLDMQTQNLDFLAGLTGVTPDGSLVVPDSMTLSARLNLDGPQCNALLKVREREGSLDLTAAYNTATEVYRADLVADSLQLHRFLPRDSIYMLSATLSAHGQGMDFTSPRTKATADLSLHRLHYARWMLSDMQLKAGLHSSVASVSLNSNNPLLQMQGEADMHLDRRYLDGQVKMNVRQVDLYSLGIVPRPLRRPFALNLNALARKDSIKLTLDAGDMDLRFRAHSTLKKLMEQLEEFGTVLTAQLEERHLDHAALRKVLPAAGMHLRAGKENPLSYYLASKDITYDYFRFSFGSTPQLGINGRTSVNGLQLDSLQLDTIFFSIKQDTTSMVLQGGVTNGPKNPQAVFRSTLTGEIRSQDAELTLNYVDGKGDTGVLFGVNARPLTEGNGKGNGLLLRLMPEEPIIAFRKFRFVGSSDWIYLHKDMRVYANVDMESDDGLGFMVQSDRNDTVSLQNMNVEVRSFRLEELSEVLPYMPHFAGLLTLSANFIQTPTDLLLAADGEIERLAYENQLVGDVSVGGTWYPKGVGLHHLDSYLSLDNRLVMFVDGLWRQRGDRDTLEVNATLDRFPLKTANAFMPPKTVGFTGELNGDFFVGGSMDKPVINGRFSMDSVSVSARQMGARYWFDNRPVNIENNRVLFNDFSIYTTSRNPFVINGNVDMRDLNRPTANLTLKAEDYTLLDAKRTRESLIYGKIFVDLNATVRGPLDALVMRGNMNLLGKTDATYVLTNSPLTVEDRLDGLVQFTSFNDTVTVAADEVPAMSLGGMDMNMTMHIDDAVRLRADLTADRSNYVELEGGGDLSLQYSPQGEMNLTGRYTLSGGVMKYSIPIIPLKEFQFNSGSYVDWRGNAMNPTLNLTATERVRASVSDGDNGASRMVNFDVSISIKNRLEAPELMFDISAPDDGTIQNELQAMTAEERSKQAITMLATGIYLNNSGKNNLNMGTALNSVIQSQINSLMGSMKNANLSVGIEDHTATETGDTQKDISFRYSQRFFNDRVQIIIGGKVSTGANATNDAESFIDNISIEYRLDNSGTRYVRLFYDKNYESVLDGEVTETGAGLVLRKKMDNLGELFIFRRKKK
ncbi:MAG: translocation/assembly module TamB domain-containing protein [Bacteroides sp.]|nr:translocation/assembly module TamB domain-containing protein [Bacteroides sp.]